MGGIKLKSKSIKKIPRKRTNKKQKNQNSTNSVSKKRVKINKKNIFNIVTFVIVAIIILSSLTIIYIQTNNIKESDSKLLNLFIKINNKIFNKEEEIDTVAIVNGIPISKEELDIRYSRLQPQITAVISKEQYLDQLIEEELLVQEAYARGYDVSNEEIKEELKILSAQAGIDYYDLEDILGEQNISIEELEKVFMRERLITKLINDSVINQVSVSEEEINKYYEDNKDSFLAPESIKVNHLIICHNESVRCDSERSREEANILTNEIYNKINETNFIELVKEYSEEPNAAISGGSLEGGTVPGYVSRQDPFDQIFMDAAFTLNPGEYSKPIETVFGVHIIKVFEKLEEGPVPLDQIRDQVNFSVTTEIQRQVFTELLDNIKEGSIINYLNKE